MLIFLIQRVLKYGNVGQNYFNHLFSKKIQNQLTSGLGVNNTHNKIQIVKPKTVTQVKVISNVIITSAWYLILRNKNVLYNATYLWHTSDVVVIKEKITKNFCNLLFKFGYISFFHNIKDILILLIDVQLIACL